MKEGDIVRLKQPFRPTVTEVQAYRYGIVAGVVHDSADTHILLRLYNLETASIYTDLSEDEAIFSFYPCEVECCISL
jgi:hypothetical protein